MVSEQLRHLDVFSIDLFSDSYEVALDEIFIACLTKGI